MPTPIPIPGATGKYRFLARHDAIVCRVDGTLPPPPGAVRAEGDWLVGFSRRCTHMGCKLLPALADETKDGEMPELAAKNGLLLCPCHASCFDLRRQGMVVTGPATDWLPALEIASDLTIDDAAPWRQDHDVPYGLPFGQTGADAASTRSPERVLSPPKLVFSTDPAARFPKTSDDPAAAPYATVPTGCQYCVVGCGYEAHLWDADAATLPPPVAGAVPDLRQGHWVSPAMTEKVRLSSISGGAAQERFAAILPDPKCPTNSGNHSSRGGTQGRDLVHPESDRASAAERITTPHVRTEAGWEELTMPQAQEITAALVKAATDWKAEQGKVSFGNPRGLGVKLYEYQYVENTYAATKLFFQLIGTPNVAFHDRPSVASNTQGFGDSGLDPHGYAYEDIWDSDVLLLIGSNPAESQSVLFMQRMMGKRIIVLDPRRTITADYAVKSGGLHLQPAVLGADVAILNAICRRIRDLRALDGPAWGEARFTAAQSELVQTTFFMDQLRVRWAATDSQVKGPDDPRRAQMRLAVEEFLAFLETQPTLEELDALGVSIERAKLEKTIRWLTGLPTEEERAATEAIVQRLQAAGDAGAAALAERWLDPVKRKVSIIFEKGIIWGYSYAGTAAVANLGLLLGCVADRPANNAAIEPPPRGVTGRAGGHQKGWCEARTKLLRGTAVVTDNYRYPFLLAQDRFAGPNGAPFFTHHYFDPHVFGPAAAQRHAHGPTLAQEPDVRLLWVIGSNAVGQVANAEEKRAALAARRGPNLPPAGATVPQIIATLVARMQAGGLVVVQQEIFPNPTTEFADLVLPARGWGEEDFVRYTGERRLRLYGRFQDAPIHLASGEMRCAPDWQIFAAIARALLPPGTTCDGAGTLPAGYTTYPPLAATHFAWSRSRDLFDELATAGCSNLAGDFNLNLLGAGGHDRLRRRGARGYLLPLAPNPDAPPTMTPQGDDLRSLRRQKFTTEKLKDAQGADVDVPASYYFIRADWRTIAEDFENNRPRAGEFAICNGRINELWNSLFTHLRNATVRARWPDTLPGTILEIDPADAHGLRDEQGEPVVSGSVVRIECDEVWRGGKNVSFSAVAIVQAETLPRGMAFAYFSYPVNRARADGRFPFRDFIGTGYVNNITTGWCDPLNPIAAVKFARGRIVPTGQRVPLAGESLAQGVVRGLSPEPRHLAFAPGKQHVANEGADRLRWKFRELIVQKGLPLAPLARHAGMVGDPPQSLPDLFRAPDFFIERLEVDGVLRKKFLSALDGMTWNRPDYWLDGMSRPLDGWTERERETARAWLR